MANKNSRNKRSKRMTIIGSIVAVVLVVALVVPAMINMMNSNSSSSSQYGEAVTARDALNRIKKLGKIVVAEVNDVKISQLQLDREVSLTYTEELQKGTARVDQMDAIRANEMRRLVSNALVLSAAKEAGYTISKAQIDSLVDEEKGQYSSLTEWQQVLNNWDFTEEMFREYKKNEYICMNYPALAIGNTQPTEEDIQAEYQSRLQGDPTLKLDEIRSNIITMLQYSKQSEAYTAWYDGLEANATIKYNMPRTEGYMQLQDKEYENAEASFKKAMELEPKDPYIPLHLGVVLIRLEKFDEGEQMVKKAMELEPLDPFIPITYARELETLKEFDRSAEILRQAVEMAKDDISAHSEIRAAFKRMGFQEDADKEYAILEELLDQSNQAAREYSESQQ